MKWNWVNVPVPPQHVIGLVLGWTLHFVWNEVDLGLNSFGVVIGWGLILAGLGLALWSILEAGESDMAGGAKLITTGPFALSRNPMYVAWTLIFIGVGLAADSYWILLLTPVVTAYTHWVDVQAEEQRLEAEFGDHYRQYMKQVRRYL